MLKNTDGTSGATCSLCGKAFTDYRNCGRRPRVNFENRHWVLVHSMQQSDPTHGKLHKACEGETFGHCQKPGHCSSKWWTHVVVAYNSICSHEQILKNQETQHYHFSYFRHQGLCDKKRRPGKWICLCNLPHRVLHAIQL